MAYRVLVQATLGGPPWHGAYRDSQPLAPSIQGMVKEYGSCHRSSSAYSVLNRSGSHGTGPDMVVRIPLVGTANRRHARVIAAS